MEIQFYRKRSDVLRLQQLIPQRVGHKVPVEVCEVVAGHVEPGEVVHRVEDALDLRDGVGVEAEGAHAARSLEGPPGEAGEKVAREVQDLQVGGAPASVHSSLEE